MKYLKYCFYAICVFISITFWIQSFFNLITSDIQDEIILKEDEVLNPTREYLESINLLEPGDTFDFIFIGRFHLGHCSHCAVLSEKGLKIYSHAWDDPIYKINYRQLAGIDIEYANEEYSHTVLNVIDLDGYSTELFLPDENRRDKEFYSRLYSYVHPGMEAPE